MVTERIKSIRWVYAVSIFLASLLSLFSPFLLCFLANLMFLKNFGSTCTHTVE